VISLTNLGVVASVDLEAPEDRGPSDVASCSKLRLSPFWSWRGLNVARRNEVREFALCKDKANHDMVDHHAPRRWDLMALRHAQSERRGDAGGHAFV